MLVNSIYEEKRKYNFMLNQSRWTLSEKNASDFDLYRLTYITA